MNLRLTGAVSLSVWLLALPPSVAAQEPAAINPKLTQSPSPLAIATANTPEVHFRLAEYFRALASQEQALARSYDRIAKIYKEKVPPPGLDPVSAREMKDQYKRLAETEKRAAAAAATVAAYHNRLADLMGHLSLGAKQVNPQDSAFRR